MTQQFLFERHKEADAGSANRDATVVRRGRKGFKVVMAEDAVDPVFISAFKKFYFLLHEPQKSSLRC